MLDKERFCTNKLWHLNFLAPTFWNWRQNLIPGDFSGTNIFGARAAPAYGERLAAEPQPLMVFLLFFFLGRPQGYGFHPIKNLRNSYQEYVAPFNSNFHNKTLCESGVMWIARCFVTYLSIAFHIYLLTIINFQLIIIKKCFNIN